MFIYWNYLELSMEKQTILIIGGGIAGLTACRALAGHYNITLLEGSGRLGGRVFSDHHNTVSGVVERGAEFVHGGAKNTLDFLKEAGIEYRKMPGKMYRTENGRLEQLRDFVEHWDKMLDKMKEADERLTLDEFLEQEFPGEEYAELKKQARQYAEGFDLADPAKVSAAALYEEWSEEEGEMYHIPRGYSALVDFLAEKCREQGAEIIVGALVKQVSWHKDDVTVQCADGRTYKADKLIVTIPVGVLQHIGSDAHIDFNPALENHMAAIQKVGWGTVIKAILQFSEPIADDDVGFVVSEEIFPTWWTWSVNKDNPVWTGWLGGPKAKELSGLDRDALIEKVLVSFANIFDIPVDKLRGKLKAGEIINWQNDTYALGGYCYATTETKHAREILNMPVEDTIYFAGEGLYQGSEPGTVEAAIVSGLQVMVR